MLLALINFVLILSLMGESSAETQNSTGWDSSAGTLALYHSENAYCSPDSYLTRSYSGKLSGFVPTYHIYDKSTDTQGYIGYTSGQSTIYVVFRGSSSIPNWISNIDLITVKYPPCANCYVHQGFYLAEQKIINATISQVKSLKSKFPSYKVLVAGHSLGGALATLAAVDLFVAGISPVRMFNFGSPRVGDNTFAAWVSSTVPDHSRVTHCKDEVPHLPSSGTVQHFTHINGEYFQADKTNIALTTCTGYEDPKCSYQYNAITSGSIDDHLHYLGITMGAEGCAPPFPN